MRTDLNLLYAATERIGELPTGSSVLDVPCGGGVALRGVKPGQGLRYVAADIAPPMLERTQRQAERLGLTDQVETRAADIGALPFADGEFDLVVSFTGLHCVPDPHGATLELGRVTRPGGEITGSLFLADVPLRRRYFLALGRASGLVGPSATSDEVVTWLGEAAFERVGFVRSGDLGYFTGTKAPRRI
ncbi:MAG: class I SAM-dependent methyltransferase [Actinomycetota bacterium]|nr:class I SAM-dependent methyltransferase [Actinomycetota bacterium]